MRALALGAGLWSTGLWRMGFAGVEAPLVLENQHVRVARNRFNPPVVHAVKTAGDVPLRNNVIEFKR